MSRVYWTAAEAVEAFLERERLARRFFTGAPRAQANYLRSSIRDLAHALNSVLLPGETYGEARDRLLKAAEEPQH